MQHNEPTPQAMQPASPTQLPAALVREFDGAHLEARLADAVRLSTVSEDGWPHGAQLSAGEILAVNATTLLIASWPQSSTTANLMRDGRLTLSLVHDGALLEIRARSHAVSQRQTALALSVFRVDIESVTEHRAKYAEVLSGVTFRLYEPAQVLSRWREQISMLRALA
ncbi:pyridoxamine 5'-phosphate oxidase family protein [Paraburkholderia sp. CNPSo 3281]|uniref:pyridoxamine 5'-phosphate oxidase family protein n=1 Tax=Paraburkholderia sp. CNPSo 3281 TaxID=2940933 RepID=UPI0020B8DC60|nr:pyridoxamine 5'-phosphate oxidase family protein [Paraburkholderia sp. CNPSo 3281]MCP3719102.1 pyridoxamine 5'-phosphate oxidase family protein [Paraburkholderia sp. CNPSo 3281]